MVGLLYEITVNSYVTLSNLYAGESSRAPAEPTAFTYHYQRCMFVQDRVSLEDTNNG